MPCRHLILLGRIAGNSGLGLVSLVAAAAGVETLNGTALLKLGGGRDVVLCVLGLGRGLLLLSVVWWCRDMVSLRTYVARVAVNNVLTLDGAVVAGSVSVAGHCECLCGVEVVGEIVEVQLQYEFLHKRDRSCYILIAIQMLFAKCMWGDDVVSVIVERPGDRTHVLEGLSSGYLTLGTR